MDQPLETRIDTEAITSTTWQIEGIRLGHGIYRTIGGRLPSPASPPASTPASPALPNASPTPQSAQTSPGSSTAQSSQASPSSAPPGTPQSIPASPASQSPAAPPGPPASQPSPSSDSSLPSPAPPASTPASPALPNASPTAQSAQAPPGSPASPPAPDLIRLHFGLRGNYSFHYRQLDRTFDLIGGHHNLMYSREFNIEVRPHSPELEIFGVQFERDRFIQFTQNASDALKRFAEDILEGRSTLFSESWGAIDPQIQQVIRQITNCSYGGDLKRLFLLSKSIELLVLSADACSNAPKDGIIKSRSDREKIIAARDLVNSRVDDPPSLSEIARGVGLNEYKLKRGFKETFNTTVFEYLSEQRLRTAFQSLLDTEKTAAEIAAELGYSSPQHFNNAFKKKYGQTPQSVRKTP